MRGGKLSISAPSWLFWTSRPIFSTYSSRAIDTAYFCGKIVTLCRSQSPQREGAVDPASPNRSYSDAKSDPVWLAVLARLGAERVLCKIIILKHWSAQWFLLI